MSERTMSRLLLLAVGTIGCRSHDPALIVPETTCLHDERGERWVSRVRNVEGSRAPAEKTYLIRDEAECQRALGLFARAYGLENKSEAAYAIRRADRGYVIIVPGHTSGEWQNSYWIDEDGKPGPVILGL